MRHEIVDPYRVVVLGCVEYDVVLSSEVGDERRAELNSPARWTGCPCIVWVCENAVDAGSIAHPCARLLPRWLPRYAPGEAAVGRSWRGRTGSTNGPTMELRGSCWARAATTPRYASESNLSTAEPGDLDPTVSTKPQLRQDGGVALK